MQRQRSDLASGPSRTGWRAGALACAACLAATLGAAVPRIAIRPAPNAIVMLPQLSVTPRAGGYTLNANCSTGGGAITFHLTVSNTGAGPSAADMGDRGGVVVSTALRTGNRSPSIWSTGAALPAIPAHGSVPVDVTLMPLETRSQMDGTHDFRVVVNAAGHIRTESPGGNSTDITATIPAGFCRDMAVRPADANLMPPSPSPVMSPDTVMSSTRQNAGALGVGHLQSQPPPSKGMTTHVPAHLQLTPVVAAPADLQYTNSPTVCTAHAGTGLASLICPGLISGKTALPLVWDWQACNAVGCVSRPDGYRIYRVTDTVFTGGLVRLGTRTLVDTQTDPSMTIRGISPYHNTDCYVVTAYKGATESGSSNEWCGAANLSMGTAVVTVKPTATHTTQGLITPIGGCDPGYTPYVRTNGEGIERYDTGSCGVDWVYHTFYQWDLSTAIPKDKVISKVLFVAYSSVQQLTEGKSSLPCAITGVDQISWLRPDITLVTLQSLPNIYLPQTHIDVQINSHGVLADLTRWFATSRSIAMGYEHTRDDYANVHDTCLALFADPHLDVTYYP